MKPLLKNDLKAFLERFEHVRGGEIVSFQIITPTSFKITLTAQDKNRAFDWVNLNLELSGVTDAKLLDDSALRALDMEEGINIDYTDEGILLGFGAEEYLASPLRLCTEVLKYEESPFSL